jgi:PAS domain S-box-containing protein
MARDVTREQRIFLSTAPAEGSDRRLAVSVVLVSAALFIAVAPYVRMPLPRAWGFIPIYEAALATNDLITASLLFAQFTIGRSRAVLVLASGYLFTACIVVPHALTFPGLFSLSGLLDSGPQTAAWLYMVWHSVFPIAVIAYALLKEPHGGAEPWRGPRSGAIVFSVGVVIVLVCAFTLLATAGEKMLPPIMQDGEYAAAMKYVSASVWALSFTALIVLRRRRPHSVLDLWLMVVMCAWLFDVALSCVLNTGRFDVGYYVGRVYGLVASSFVLIALLLQMSALYTGMVRLLKAEQHERDRAAGALRDSLARQDAMFSSATIGILTLNESGTIETINPAAEHMFGYTSAALARRDIGRLIDLGEPDDIGSGARLCELERSRNAARQFVGRHSDGSTFPIELVLAEMSVSDRRMFVAFVHDIRARTLAEDKFELAVESCPNGMVMTDAAGAILLVNAETERLFGYPREELIGQSIDILVPERFRAKHPRHRKAFTDHPKARAMGKGRELFGLRKDGTEFPIEIGLNPIETRDGLLILSAVVDISERKRNERLKSEFVATVSHELRTPLTSIAASLGLLDGGSVGQIPASAMRLLKIAHANSDRLVRLINDILDIEKIESGKAEFHMQRVDVRLLVEQAIEGIHPSADARDVRVRIESARVSAISYADPDRLMQVVTNLLSNAVKFSPVGGDVEVTVVEAGGNVHIGVRDHGQGIPEEFRPRVFEKFAQADATDVRQKSGTGLGLSIVKQIVTRLGGEVGFASAHGGGTIFRVSLPAWRLNSTAGGEHAGGAPLLLCEVDPAAATSLCGQLRDAGFNADVAELAAEAAGYAAAKPYVAILVNVQTPDTAGIALIKELRSRSQSRDVPIFVVSTDRRTPPLSGKPTSTLNVLDWLPKPVDVQQLKGILSRPIVREAHPRPRVLHVDDDSVVLDLVANALRATADVISVDSLTKARSALAEGDIDLAVIDLALAEGFGLDLLPDLHDAEGQPIPVVVFSAQDTPEITARVFAALTKSRASIDSLVAILRRIVMNKRSPAPTIEEVA